MRDSAILSFKEFERIKRNSQLNPEPEQRVIEENKNQENRLAKARAHRDKLKAYDKLHIKTTIDESEEEMYNRKKNQQILERAQRMMETQDDAVKTMDKMVLYAQIATIRDRQREDVKQQEEIFKKKEEKLDILMEINRLKEMKQQEEIDNERRRQQREGSLVIIDQIKARKAERQREKEQEEKERLKMLERIKEQDEKEKRKNEEIEKRNAQIMKEILEANKQSILDKERKKEEERELERKLIEYNKEKVRKEEE